MLLQKYNSYMKFITFAYKQVLYNKYISLFLLNTYVVHNCLYTSFVS